MSAILEMERKAIIAQAVKVALRAKDDEVRKVIIAQAFKGITGFYPLCKGGRIAAFRYVGNDIDTKRQTFGWSQMRDFCVILLHDQGITPDLELIELMKK